jgi:hypothetical protein
VKVRAVQSGDLLWSAWKSLGGRLTSGSAWKRLGISTEDVNSNCYWSSLLNFSLAKNPAFYLARFRRLLAVNSSTQALPPIKMIAKESTRTSHR